MLIIMWEGQTYKATYVGIHGNVQEDNESEAEEDKENNVEELKVKTNMRMKYLLTWLWGK